MFKRLIIFIVIVLMVMNIAGAVPYQEGSFDPVRHDVDSWTCVDHAINYARENPEWGVVTVSSNPNFKGRSHMVNYHIVDGELHIYDATQNLRMDFCDTESAREGNIQFNYAYYHIWDLNETPKRNYRVLKDNIGEYYPNENI